MPRIAKVSSLKKYKKKKKKKKKKDLKIYNKNEYFNNNYL